MKLLMFDDFGEKGVRKPINISSDRVNLEPETIKRKVITGATSIYIES